MSKIIDALNLSSTAVRWSAPRGWCSALLSASLILLAGCDFQPEPKWPGGVPDSYDPVTDGPVWLGPYRFIKPEGLAIYNSVSILEFQLLVDGNRVSFYDGTPLAKNYGMSVPLPEGAWLSGHSMSYDAPIPGYPPAGVELAPEVKVDLENRQIQTIWNPTSVDLMFPRIIMIDGTPLTFHCHFSHEAFLAASEQKSFSMLESDANANNCRTFFGLRPGIRVLIDFPATKFLRSSNFIPEMIALLKTTVTEK